MRDPALDAWGGYDRDNPFPLFARVRAAGPVHEVTLPDGQRAWLVARHAEARAALNDPRPVQGHARRARPRRRRGRRGPARPRVRPAHAQRRPARPHPAARAGHGRVQPPAGRRAAPADPAIVDDLLDELHRRGDTVVDLVAGFAFPLPFTVISELLGVPEPDRAELGAWFTTLLAPASAPEPPPSAVAASANIVALPRPTCRPQTRRAGRGPGHRPRPGGRRARRAEPAGDAVHDLPARPSPGTTPPRA